MGEKAYGYLRVSGQGQVTGDGFDRQLETIEAYARKNRVELCGIFRDEGVSGTRDETDRPAFQAMVAEILRNGVRTVIVERLDRLAREYRIQESLLIYLASKGVDLVVAATEENVTAAIQADPMKKALVQMQGVFSELEKNLLVKKLRTARDRKRAETGKCEGRKGYHDTDQGRELLRKIKALRRRKKGSRRFSYQDVADELNRQGIPTLTGQTWTRHRVYQALNV